MDIKPNDVGGSHKQGSLSSTLGVADIAGALGFGPNHQDDPDKVKFSWSFTADGKQCGVWDYKGLRWSTYGPSRVFKELFPGMVHTL